MSFQLCDVVKQYVGQKVAVLCTRYQYRGVLSDVSETHITLSNACAVEISGPSSANTPNTEDIIGTSVHINVRAVELVYQPNWCFAPLPGE